MTVPNGGGGPSVHGKEPTPTAAAPRVRIPSTCPTDGYGRHMCYFAWDASLFLWECKVCGGERTMAEAQELGKAPPNKTRGGFRQ